MNPTITQAIMNLPPVDQQDPVKWVEALQDMRRPSTDPKKTGPRMFTNDQIAQALQAWVSEAGPQSWQDLLNLHQTDPTHVAAWLAVMDPTTKLRVTHEIEQIVQANQPAQPAPPSPPAPSDDDLKKLAQEIGSRIISALPGASNHDHDAIVTRITDKLKTIRNHPSKTKVFNEAPFNNKTVLDYIDGLIGSSRLGDAQKKALHDAIAKADRDPKTVKESLIPHVPIGKTILAKMNIK